jgi:hypothetical protein
MNLDYVIIGSDTNPDYFDFWEIISKIWKEKFKITPVLGLICDENSDLYESEFGLIKKFKKIQNVDVSLQSQIVRLFLPKFLNGKCLISDIDMIPLSKKYFEENSRNLNDENIIVYSSDNPECLLNNMYPMCYVSAHSKIFKHLFELEKYDWSDFTLTMKNRNEGWYTDQKILFEKINKYDQKILLKRGWSGQANNRVDRINWVYDELKVKNEYYIDSHSLRPYGKFKNEINDLIKNIT